MSQNIPYTRKGDIEKGRLSRLPKPPGRGVGLRPPTAPKTTKHNMETTKQDMEKTVKEISGVVLINNKTKEFYFPKYVFFSKRMDLCWDFYHNNLIDPYGQYFIPGFVPESKEEYLVTDRICARQVEELLNAYYEKDGVTRWPPLEELTDVDSAVVAFVADFLYQCEHHGVFISRALEIFLKDYSFYTEYGQESEDWDKNREIARRSLERIIAPMYAVSNSRHPGQNRR